MGLGSKIAKRYLAAKYKAPRKGFPPQYEKAAETLSDKIEARGHDLTQWQQLGGKGGWFATCANCGIQIKLNIGDYDGVESLGGMYLQVANRGRYEKCVPEARELVRGMRVEVPEGIEVFLQQPPAKIAATIIASITKAGLGASWTSPDNMATAYAYALDGSGSNYVPIVLHAEFHRSDQKRNYKPAGFVVLEGYEHEREIYLDAKEVVRLKQIDWYDGKNWHKAKVAVKAKAGNWGRDPHVVGFKLRSGLPA